jgi:16S rRNA (guanine527-N7)-methyltransferase
MIAVDFIDGLAAQYALPPASVARLATLAAMVLDPNEDALANRPAAQKLVVNRIANSVAAVELEQVRSARRIADIGSGLGFPGLMLAAALPDASVVLIDKEARRCAFLRRAVAAMGLANVEVVHKHVQSWSQGFESFELVTMRSVARPSVAVRFAAPLLTVGGTALIWGNVKREPEKEADAEAAAEVVGLRPITVLVATPVGAARRHLYVYEKVAATSMERLPEPQAFRPSRIRQERKRGRASAVATAHDKAVERLERARQRVRRLAGSGDPDAAEELERAQAVVSKVEQRVEVLKRRLARAERKVQPSPARNGEGAAEGRRGPNPPWERPIRPGS